MISGDFLLRSACPAPRGAFRGRAPQMTACAPQTKIVPPPKRGLCPKGINRLGAIKVQIEASPKLVFSARIFVIFVDSHRILYNFLDEDLFFLFLVFTHELVKNCKNFETTTRVCGNFRTEDLIWSSPCLFDPHWNKFLVPPCPFRIHINKLLVLPQNLFLPPSHAILAPGLEIGRSPRNRESLTKSGKLAVILVDTALYITYLQIYLNLKFVVIKNKVKIENAYRVHYSFFV